MVNRDHFLYVPSQWETMLQCNVVLSSLIGWAHAKNDRCLTIFKSSCEKKILCDVCYAHVKRLSRQVSYMKFGVQNFLEQLSQLWSVSWLLMPWHLVGPGHHQAWHFSKNTWFGSLLFYLRWAGVWINCTLLLLKNGIKCKYVALIETAEHVKFGCDDMYLNNIRDYLNVWIGIRQYMSLIVYLWNFQVMIVIISIWLQKSKLWHAANFGCIFPISPGSVTSHSSISP